MDHNSAPPQVDLVIPMLPNMEVAATKTATAIAEYMKFDADQADEVKMALIEACINAFEHSQSHDRKVYIKFLIDQDALQVVVTDHGDGFNPTQVERPDITKKIGGDHKRGWGLMLIESLMDGVDIQTSEAGTTLVMIKKRTGANQ